ncbi:hypothetical protein AAG906_005610 [Vitis piasezkii]
MDVTFLESKNFYPSPVPNSSIQGETQVEKSNWLMAPVGERGIGNKEVESHEVPPEIEHVELRKYRNVPEVSTPTAPLHANILDSTSYVLPFRHNRGKPPNKYNPDEEERKSKYPIANYVSTQGLSKLLKTFTQTLSSCHIPSCVEEALFDPEWVQVMQEELEALKKNNT